MNYTDSKIIKPKRMYFAEDLDINNWEVLEREFQQLLEEKIESETELISFMEKVGELSDILDEEMAWRYIRMTQFADKEEYEQAFNEFYGNIISKTKPYGFKINKKFYDSPFRKKLSKQYEHLNQIISNEIELFREENIELQTQEQELSNKYGSIYSKLTVEFDGEEKTLSQLSVYLKDQNRDIRKKAWMLRMDKMAEVKDELNSLFDEMKVLRVKQAKNAGFENYRDYMHQEKGRFSYTPEDLYKFHSAVEKVVIPFLKEDTEERRLKLGLDSVRPWDTSVELDGKTLKPFDTIEQFIDTAIKILYSIKPQFGINLNMMKNSGFLDLENRKGKAPGGYNYPLMETGAPFIFMNAVGLHRDVVTLLHESGHAMHSFAMKHIKLDPYKGTPSEVAELASMGMEFLSLDYWNLYYSDENDFKKAKKDQLVGALSFLPWCMMVDAFQHWIYTNPNHTIAERKEYFISLLDRYNTGVDWDNIEEYKELLWLFQGHIFEVPFYYIEYGMSQLGALAIYMNLKKNGLEDTLTKYEDFLSLGYSKPVSDLYKTAGIKFDFSEEYLSELVEFVKKEIKDL